MGVITDKQSIDTLLERGVENIYPSRDFLEKELLSGKQLTLYTGYDPTGPSLHLGHGITMVKLRQFQDLGHKIIMLIGDFTAMIGDPTDKTSTRQVLTREQVLENCKEYQKQAAAVLNFGGENPVEIRYNSEWLAGMTFTDVVELSSHFTVQRMFERDMFQRRLEEEKPIYLHEFLYPMMQGYDSVAMGVDGEVGGNDQTFNMLTGRTLMKDLKNKEKFVLTTKLLVDGSGKKMGKSEGNAISLSDSPEDVFGKVMRWTDDMIERGFELCTRIDMDEMKRILLDIHQGANPRDAKLRLAFDVTAMFLGVEAAEQGKKHFANVIQQNEKPEDIPELTPTAYDIVTVLVEAGFAKSNSDAKQTIDGGGVKINDEKVESFSRTVQSGDVIQKGKRFFVKIK